MNLAGPAHPALVWIFVGLPVGLSLMGVLLFAARWNRLRGRSRRDPEDILLGAVSQSLRERGQLAASLGELRTVHERLLDALPFGILWVDQQQRVAALNEEGRKLLGVRPGVVGLEAGFVLEPFPWLHEALAQVPGRSWRCDGGARRWRLRRVEAPDKVGALVQFEDITQLEVEERRVQLRERFAEIGEMTAGIAHQMKNGLAVLRGQGQLLRRAGQEAAAQDILAETEELERVLQRFLQWAKPLVPACAPLRLEEAAAQAVAELRKRPVSQGRAIEVQGEGTAEADAMLLHQALVNLLENACQATPLGGRVLVRVGEGRIEVLDDGEGMGEDTMIRML
ncbi:MAG TPA: histidine kinase dimerization/phospho-acceptor domain-containing protein, partial [Holophaga sp.]|nr:histidine kinase dimerization/phospho-acceptor domain-containing protein [Holophaga sp.]